MKFESIRGPIKTPLFIVLVVIVVLGSVASVCSKLNDPSDESLSDRTDVYIADACNNDESFCLRNVILIKGNINAFTIEKFLELVNNENATFAGICLESYGGRVMQAERLGKAIKDSITKTCVADKYYYYEDGRKVMLKGENCSSACTNLLLAGARRYRLGDNVKMGVHHSGQFIDLCFCKIPVNTDFSNDDYVYSDNPKHHEFMAFSDRTDYEDIYWLTPLDFERFEVFTHYY